MATKNIEININNGNGYDILYPKTVVTNIGDLSSNYYNKTESNNTFYNKSYINSNYYTKTDVDKMVKNSSEWVNEGTYLMDGTFPRVRIGASGKDFRGKDVIIQLNYVRGSFTPKDTNDSSYISIEYGGGMVLNITRIFRKGRYYINDYTNSKWKPYARMIPMTSGSFSTNSKLANMGYLSITSETTQNGVKKSNFNPEIWGSMSEINAADDVNFLRLCVTNYTSVTSLKYSITVYTKSIPVYTY